MHLLKPQTFMNDSGRALSGLAPAEPGGPLDDLLVLVDEVALPVGSFRIRAHGSAGGHNGLTSVETTIRTRHYARLRIGVGHKPADVDDLADHVLERMPEADRRAVDELMPTLCEAVECWMTEGVERAMSRFNRRVHDEPEPPRI